MTAPREEERRLVPPALARDAHKGRAGRVLTVAGSRTMPGAATLVARAAQRAGAGLVTAGCLDAELLGSLAVSAPEAVLLDLARLADLPFALETARPHAVVAGPGMGQTERTREAVRVLVNANLAGPLVLDADALNVLADEPERLKSARATVVITPHPGEAERLLGRAVPRERDGRVAFARELARLTGAIVCLKGLGTVVTEGELVYVNDTGNPGMATAGAGDVLAGILGAYLALTATGEHEGWTPLDAACTAVRAHGLAGDLAAAHVGERALVASDLVASLAGAQRRMEA